jgi:hypothetical protein
LTAVAACVLGTASAQTPLAVFELEGPFGTVGERVGVAGDVTGDGVPDILAAQAAVVFDLWQRVQRRLGEGDGDVHRRA